MTINYSNYSSEREKLKNHFHSISHNNEITLEEKREMLTKFLENNFFLHPNLANFLTNRTLTSKGIEYILRKRVQKYPRAAAIKVCEFLEDFFQECQNVEKKPTFAIPFIVHNQTHYEPSAHFTPVYIQKNLQETCIFLSDSLGVAYYPNVLISMRLHEIFPKAKQYILMPHRQFDENSCRIFCIKDTLFFARHPEIFSQLQNPSVLDTHCLGLPENFVKVPPPSIMTYTQSARVKAEYLAHANQAYDPLQLDLLNAKWEKYQAPLNSSGKRANGRALHFLCKYVEEILEAYCRNELS